MLLPSIFITVVVCTVEICEFLSAFPLFICPSRPWDNLSPVSRDHAIIVLILRLPFLCRRLVVRVGI